MLKEIINQTFLEDEEEERSKRKEDLISKFADYRKEVKDRYFDMLWLGQSGSSPDAVTEDVLRRRGRRYVFRFIMALERNDPSYLPLYPACFCLWLAVSRDPLYGDFSMYPCEGMEAPRDMSPWETTHCPWYMDTTRWLTPLGDEERQARRMIDGGNAPQTVFSSVKEDGTNEQAQASAECVENAAKEQQHYPDQSRKVSQAKKTS